MAKFRKICAIIGIVTSIIATFYGARGWYRMLTSSSAPGDVSLLVAAGFSLLSYILGGGILHTIKAALSMVKWGFLFVLDMPGIGWLLGPLFGLGLAGVALVILPFFPVFFVFSSVKEKGLLAN